MRTAVASSVRAPLHAGPASRPHRGPLWADALLLGLAVAVFGGLVAIGRRWAAPLERAAAIDLSLAALPRYALFSLSRGFVAYGLSLVFTLAYGTLAAHSRRGERLLLPLLDVLQSVPVLSFLPALVIGLVALFPRSNVGLELACVLAIFSGQAWNMAFAYYASVRAIPTELSEVARVHRFSRWRRFVGLEAPSAMIGLVWNSMMSMAGGWFFLTVVEQFTLGGQSYRLPGLGSYMDGAIAAGDGGAMAAACAAMVLMIVLVDQLLWRPVIAWSQRFKVEEVGAAQPPTSFVYDLLRRSRLSAWLGERARRRRERRLLDARPTSAPSQADDRRSGWASRAGAVALLLLGACAVAWGAVEVVRLLAGLSLPTWGGLAADLGLTAARVAAAVGIGALWTVPVGLAVGLSPRLARIAQPVIEVVASFPMPMLYPLLAPALVRAGLPFGVVSVVLLLFGTQWYVLFNVVAGAMAVPEDLREVAAVGRLRPLARLRRLYLPAIFPYLLTGLVTAAGGAWNASIVAEWVSVGSGRVMSARGIGATIAEAFARDDDARLAGGVLVMCGALLVVHRFLWKRLYALASGRYALNR